MTTVTLYRPIGPEELVLIEQTGFTKFPPRLPEQPIFYPVVQEAYATRIAKEWNVKDSGVGFVTSFAVDASYLGRFEEQVAGGREYTEYWIPAKQLEEFNEHIVGTINVIAEFR
jgi:hypothetical protein